MSYAKLPKALRPGDTIGLIAPSGSTKDATMAARGAAALEALGFRVKTGESCTRGRYGYLAASDELRASDLNAYFADPGVDGIVCMKGGYGTPRMLDLVDYGLIAANPKVFVGYSDITGLHLAMRGRVGFPTFHGPMAVSMAGGFDDFSKASWLRAVTATGPLGRLEPPAGPGPEPFPRLECLSPGRAEGPLTGGNLSLVAALAGTPYAMDARGAVVYLEDVDEEPYRLDRMLTQLRLAGVFRDCAGLVLGHWTRCEAKDPERALTLRQVLLDVVVPAMAGKPVMAGFAAGHDVPTHTFPMGVGAALDSRSLTFDVTEAAAC